MTEADMSPEIKSESQDEATWQEGVELGACLREDPIENPAEAGLGEDGLKSERLIPFTLVLL